MIDEDHQRVAVGQVGIDVGLVGLRHVAHAEVPDVARLTLRHLLEDAVGLIVDARALGHEEAGEGVVPGGNLLQVARDLGDVALAGQHPVAQEGIVGHHRGDEDRPHQILLDFGIDGVARHRQLVVDDLAADGTAGHEVAGEAGGQETDHQKRPDKSHQAPLVGDRTHGVFPPSCGPGFRPVYRSWRRLIPG